MSKFTDAIIAAAQGSQRTYGVPASVSLAQFAIESAYGTRMPPDSRNPFGIKAKDGQDYVTAKTREVINGKSVMVVAKFRKFASFDEAFVEHAKLLATKPVYAPAMKAWTVDNDLEKGVKLMSAWYATDGSYASKIMAIIRAQNLDQYDHLGPIVPKPADPAPVPVPAPKSNWLAALIELILNIIKAFRK